MHEDTVAVLLGFVDDYHTSGCSAQREILAERIGGLVGARDCLVAENARLRAALEALANLAQCPDDGRNAYEANTTLEELRELALAALTEDGALDA